MAVAVYHPKDPSHQAKNKNNPFSSVQAVSKPVLLQSESNLLDKKNDSKHGAFHSDSANSSSVKKADLLKPKNADLSEKLHVPQVKKKSDSPNPKKKVISSEENNKPSHLKNAVLSNSDNVHSSHADKIDSSHPVKANLSNSKKVHSAQTKTDTEQTEKPTLPIKKNEDLSQSKKLTSSPDKNLQQSIADKTIKPTLVKSKTSSLPKDKVPPPIPKSAKNIVASSSNAKIKVFNSDTKTTIRSKKRSPSKPVINVTQRNNPSLLLKANTSLSKKDTTLLPVIKRNSNADQNARSIPQKKRVLPTPASEISNREYKEKGTASSTNNFDYNINPSAVDRREVSQSFQLPVQAVYSQPATPPSYLSPTQYFPPSAATSSGLFNPGPEIQIATSTIQSVPAVKPLNSYNNSVPAYAQTSIQTRPNLLQQAQYYGREAGVEARSLEQTVAKEVEPVLQKGEALLQRGGQELGKLTSEGVADIKYIARKTEAETLEAIGILKKELHRNQAYPSAADLPAPYSPCRN